MHSAELLPLDIIHQESSGWRQMDRCSDPRAATDPSNQPPRVIHQTAATSDPHVHAAFSGTITFSSCVEVALLRPVLRRFWNFPIRWCVLYYQICGGECFRLVNSGKSPTCAWLISSSLIGTHVLYQRSVSLTSIFRIWWNRVLNNVRLLTLKRALLCGGKKYA